MVVNVVLLAARWSRDRQFSYISLISLSGELFPLIFHPHRLQLEPSVESRTLHHRQSHQEEEVPGWQTDVKRCLCWLQLKQLRGMAGGEEEVVAPSCPAWKHLEWSCWKDFAPCSFCSSVPDFWNDAQRACTGGCSNHKASRSIPRNFPGEASWDLHKFLSPSKSKAHGKFRLDTRKKFFTERAVGTGMVVESPPLEVLEKAWMWHSWPWFT